MSAHAKKLYATGWIVVGMAQILAVHGSPSTLKVAVCNPGQLPYATMDSDGNLLGYDIGTNPARAQAAVSEEDTITLYILTCI
jgi:hypothetical protein